MKAKRTAVLKYTAVAVLLALSHPEARADLSVGSVYGQAPTGSTITIRNLDTGLKRELTADARAVLFSHSYQPAATS